MRLMEGGRRVFNRGAGCVHPGSRCRAALPSALQASEAAGGAGPGGHGQSLLGVPGAEPGAAAPEHRDLSGANASCSFASRTFFPKVEMPGNLGRLGAQVNSEACELAQAPVLSPRRLLGATFEEGPVPPPPGQPVLSLSLRPLWYRPGCPLPPQPKRQPPAGRSWIWAPSVPSPPHSRCF